MKRPCCGERTARYFLCHLLLQERDNPEGSLVDLDLLLAMSVPDRLVQDRRTHLFLMSLVREGRRGVEGEMEEKKSEEVEESGVVVLQGEEYRVEEVPMEILMDLSLEELREVDRRVGRSSGWTPSPWTPGFRS